MAVNATKELAVFNIEEGAESTTINVDPIAEGDTSVTWELTIYYLGFFMVLLVALVIIRRLTYRERDAQIVTGEFKKFQRNYVVVYMLMMGADWIQGPLVYALYKTYGYTIGQIGVLFIAGYGSSMVFGPFVGMLADKYGRRKMCLLFVFTYTLCALSKHFNQYSILIMGRILGGLSTSLLQSTFEAWMVHEHHQQYPEDWLAVTFSVCTSANSAVAIFAGVIASLTSHAISLVAPFDVATIFLALGGLVIHKTWTENTGDSLVTVSETFSGAVSVIKSDPKIFSLGMIQSFFEGAMYIFVFMWTPALDSTSHLQVYHGWVFASFMVCVAIGSKLFDAVVSYNIMTVERVGFITLVVSAFLLAVAGLVKAHTVRLIAFCGFELCCGVYWPMVATLRSRYIPEETRATVMNMFRIPLNGIVVLILMSIARVSEVVVFASCTILLVCALLVQYKLSKTVQDADAADKGIGLDTMGGGI